LAAHAGKDPEHGIGGELAGQVLESLERAAVGALQVVNGDEEGTGRGSFLERLPHALEDPHSSVTGRWGTDREAERRDQRREGAESLLLVGAGGGDGDIEGRGNHRGVDQQAAFAGTRLTVDENSA
jgi:hypothetical protein